MERTDRLDRDARIWTMASVDGLSYPVIGAAFGLSPKTIGNIVRAEACRRGVETRARADKAKLDTKIMAHWRATRSSYAVAARLGVSASHVRDVVRAFLTDDAAAQRRAAALESVGPSIDVLPRPSRLVPTYPIGNFNSCFGPDVEHADPVVAEYDARPLNGGRYPRSPSLLFSAFGSPAGACEES